MRFIVEVLQALRPLNEEVDQCPYKVGKNDDDDPNYPGVALIRFLGGTVYQHPQPKEESQKGCEPEQQKEECPDHAQTSGKSISANPPADVSYRNGIWFGLIPRTFPLMV
jgi:hypothetical protein